LKRKTKNRQKVKKGKEKIKIKRKGYKNISAKRKTLEMTKN
jgi:hypothetical protein